MGSVERLRLLASAIGGRPLEVAATGDGDPAWTDGATVFVDALAAPADQVRAVAVQASLVAAGSLDPAILTQLLRRPALARRYLAVEAHRALAANEAVLPPLARSLADASIVALLPDAGAEGSLAVARKRDVGEVPGWAGVLRVRRVIDVVERGDAAARGEEAAPLGGKAVKGEELDRLGDDGDYGDDGDADDEELGDVGDLLASPVGGQGVVGRLLKRLLRVAREPGGSGAGMAGGDTPSHVGGPPRHRTTATMSLATKAPDGDGPTPATAFGPATTTYPEWDVDSRRYRVDWCTVRERDPRPQDLASMEVPQGRALRRPLARLGAGLDRARRRPQGDDIDIDAVVDAQVALRAGTTPKHGPKAPTTGGSGPSFGGAPKRGPKAPYAGGSGPSFVGPRDPAVEAQTAARAGALSGSPKRGPKAPDTGGSGPPFVGEGGGPGMAVGDGAGVVGGGDPADGVDAGVEAEVASRAGGVGDTPKLGPKAPYVGGLGPNFEEGAVYVEGLRRRRDLGVLILLDISGSAGEAGPGGRTVHEHQRAAAAALARALHDLGDRVALYAFNSQGRTAVHVTRVKEFGDRFDGRVLRRLGGLTPGAYTRLGAAIRHGTSVLEAKAGTSRRLLVVLSDGFAYDHGYGGRYGEADARRVLVEARRQGVGCVCLGVGSATPPGALRRVFGAAAHASVPTLDQLPPLVGPLFQAALRTAEAQRRTFRAKERRRTA